MDDELLFLRELRAQQQEEEIERLKKLVTSLKRQLHIIQNIVHIDFPEEKESKRVTISTSRRKLERLYSM
jgi:hypothetical protein